MSDSMLHPHSALIYLMVIISAADREMTDAELRRIGDLVRTLPVFEGFDEERLVPTARECARMLSDEGGLDQVLNVVAASLPARLAATAYAIACEVAEADHHVEREEIVLLHMIRGRLDIEPLTAAALERAAIARNMRL